MTVSGVQAATLPKPIHRDVWVGQRVVITRGHFKGYHGLVKVQDASHVEVELDARLAASGQTRHRFEIGQVQLFVEYVPRCLSPHFDNYIGRRAVVPAMPTASRTPPPEDSILPTTRAATPELEEPEQSIPWSSDRRPSELLGDHQAFSCTHPR